MRVLLLRPICVNTVTSSLLSSRGLLRKSFSSKSFQITQGGSIFFDFSNTSVSNVTLTTVWQDHIEVVNNKLDCNVKFEENVIDNSLTIISSEQTNSQTNKSSIDIAVKCPELCNISIKSHELNLKVNNKLHGDVNITCIGGTISLDKIRGHNLNFNCSDTKITVHKLIEGNINIKGCSKFDSKLVNGDLINVDCAGSVTVGAVYSKNATFYAETNINIGSIHGVCKLENSKEDINVKSLDGTFDIMSESGNIFIHVNKLDHNSNSTLVSKKGNTNVNIDTAVSTKISMESTTNKELIITSDLFLNEINNGNYKMGYHLQNLDNKNYDSKGSGKINLSSAYNQSLNSFVNDSVNDKKNIASSIDIKAFGSVKVETISWMDNIKKKYGLLK